MASIDINAEIEKELNMLEPEEKDVNKIARAIHRSLLMMLIREAVMEMREENKENKDNGEGEGEAEEEEEKIKLFHIKIQKSYLEKIDFLKKTLLN